MRTSSAIVFAAAFCAGTVLSLQYQGAGSEETSAAGAGVTLGVSEAYAGPVVRSARRTARRTTRRHAYYYALPAGCVVRVVGGVRYQYCSGVYYQVVTDDAGKTAYIIVTP